MSDVLIYHPGTCQQASVPEEAVSQHRRGGWLLWSEHQSNEAARTEREAAGAGAAGEGNDGKGGKV